MFLAVAATEIEMHPFQALVGTDAGAGVATLTCGVGPVAAALNTCCFLNAHPNIRGVVLFGIAGAYLQEELPQPQLLDLCLASSEVFGDLGIVCDDHVEPLPERLTGSLRHDLDAGYLEKAKNTLSGGSARLFTGPFVTVSGVSGSRSRGDVLCRRWAAICENMEGAGVAAACQTFRLPLVEVRSVSNMVTDRDPTSWRIGEAADIAAAAARRLIGALL